MITCTNCNSANGVRIVDSDLELDNYGNPCVLNEHYECVECSGRGKYSHGIGLQGPFADDDRKPRLP